MPLPPVDPVNAAVGAVFGDVFARLSKAVEEAIIKTVMFKSNLQRLKSRIDSIKPFMEDIQKFNEILDRQEEATNKLTDQLKEGEALVDKCSKINRWNYIYKHHYAGKIEDLGKSISEFFQTDEFQMLKWRNQMEGLVLLQKIDERLNSSGGIGGTCAVPNPPDDIVGMDAALEELKMLFKDDVSVLLVTAPPGCGKTTLVKMFGHDQDIKDKFARILFVTVSKTPNLKVIVERLYDHIGCKTNKFESDDDAIHQLEQLLISSIGSKPMLLILDDVWLESTLKKFEFPIKNYKILVTSRSVFTRIQYKCHLNFLKYKEAMELFRRSAKLQDENSSIPDDLVNKIVRACGGMPLALTVIGELLCEKPVEVWRTTEKKWSNENSHESPLRFLESSLDILDDVIKKCFMDLGSFPEDQRIPVAALIDMWVELYELDEDEVIAKLDELANYNLASLVLARKVLSGVDSHYNEDFVTQHDLLRDLAIRHNIQEPIEQREKIIVDISGNNFPKWWIGQNEQSINGRLLSIATGRFNFNLLKWWMEQNHQTVRTRLFSIVTGWVNLLKWLTEQKQQSVNACLLSISTDENFSSNWCIIEPREVEVLTLNFQTKNYTLPKFVKKMGNLKVLIVTNNGFFPAELINFELLQSLLNLKRIRLENVSIPSLCKNPIPLKSLKKISLVMCSIGQAFSNCTIQISDAVPNLEEINIDYCKDLVELPVGLCDIVYLKKLRITNCHKLSALPEGIGKLENLEVLRLTSCTDLLELPESVRCLHKLRFLDITDCLSLSKLPKHIGELRNLKVLRMNGCSGLSYELPESTLDLDKQLEIICDEESAWLWDDFKDDFTNLKIERTKSDINLYWLPNMDF